MSTPKVFPIFWFSLFTPLIAEAYIGPGMGGGLIAVILGILVAIVVGFFAICWYPIKRILKKRKKSDKQGGNGGEDDSPK